MFDKFEIIGDHGTLSFEMGSPYAIDQIEGLSPPDADIHLHQMALIDGQKYNGAKVQIRTLRIAFAIERDAEASRLYAYQVLRLKRPVTVHYVSELRDVKIVGYVQKCTAAHFNMKQTITAEILCPEPYWQSYDEIINDMSQYLDNFHFPFHSTATEPIIFGILQNLATGTVINDGEVDTGITITAAFASNAEDLEIINYTDGESFVVRYSFLAGDELTVDSREGRKSVTLLRNGAQANLFNYIDPDSVWPVIRPGQTTFVFTITSGTLSDVAFRAEHTDLFAGV